MEDQDEDYEDYEVSNQVLNAYLEQFSDENLRPDTEFLNSKTNNLTKNTADQLEENTEQQEQCYKFNRSFLFHDAHQISRFLSLVKSVVTDLDKAFLLNVHLKTCNKISTNVVSRLESVKNFISTNRILLVCLSVSLLLAPASYSLKFGLILTLVLMLISLIIWHRFSIDQWLFLKSTVVVFESYLKNTRNLIYYLKDVEIVSITLNDRNSLKVRPRKSK